MPPWLHFSEPDGDLRLAIAIGPNPGEDGPVHTGILHKQHDDALKMFHLPWHGRPKNENLPRGYAWIEVPLHPDRARLVTARCRRIQRKAPHIPYAFRFRETRFSERGALRLGKNEHGLTCATFVLAVFLSEGIELLLLDGAPPAQLADKLFMAEKLTILRRQLDDLRAEGADEAEALAAHIALLEEEAEDPYCARIRPTVVAGAASSVSLPSSTTHASEAGQAIEAAFASRS